MNLRRELVNKWLHKAEHDFETAGGLSNTYPHLTDVICYHCQQAVEKYFKAFMVSLGLAIKTTHDLMSLLETIEANVNTSNELSLLIEDLSEYAVETRYPTDGDDVEISELEARITFDKTKRIKEIILPEIEKRLKELENKK
jgi:HEPN domain-containing protein